MVPGRSQAWRFAFGRLAFDDLPHVVAWQTAVAAHALAARRQVGVFFGPIPTQR